MSDPHPGTDPPPGPPRPTLAICIPTYNRAGRLAKTLATVAPQLTDDVVLVIWDNCSPDDTIQSVRGSGIPCTIHRQEQNLGPDRNFLSCLTDPPADYVWLLCDDDLLCPNAVQCVLQAVRQHDRPPVVYVRTKASDILVSDYKPIPVQTPWKPVDRNQFLHDVSYMFTFGSSIILRRDRIDLDFTRRYIGSAILQSAALLAAAATDQPSVISEKPLIYARGGNAGGYDAFTVFSKNIRRLFRDCRRLGYRRDVLRRIYNDNLAGVMIYIVDVWPMTFRGLFNLIVYSAGHRCFYTRVVPALARRAARPVKSAARRLRFRPVVAS